ncbi:reverse transcriptase [Lasius niger]|uniref:Reverse transcriptase n=1 Tax=Lasius niger TaxID=67767 RepID=A0A0J7K3T2_LASNI|nr:reverse transcriptase [Lasius niger]
MNVDEDAAVLDVGRPDNHVCPVCLRSFTSRIGLGLHKKKQHPVEYNEEINIVRVKPRWSEEEIRILAMDEAQAPPRTMSINIYLWERRDEFISLESIKGVRRKQSYKDLVTTYRDQLLAEKVDESLERQCSVPVVPTETPLSGSEAAMNWLMAKVDDIIPEMNGGK